MSRKKICRQSAENASPKSVSLLFGNEVLTKYYEFLHSHQAEKTYRKFEKKDAGGGNLKQMAGASLPELEEACSAEPECVAFNSAGWLKSERRS